MYTQTTWNLRLHTSSNSPTQKPHCVPQGMQPHIVVKEVPSMKLDDLYNVSTLSDLSEDDVVKIDTLTKMQEEKVYEVKIHLNSETVNRTSLPTFGTWQLCRIIQS